MYFNVNYCYNDYLLIPCKYNDVLTKKVFKAVFSFLTSEATVYRIFLADKRAFDRRPQWLL